MDKKILLNRIITQLSNEHLLLTEAANNARAASTDEQSVAETQYDTLAIEAGYLAEGQAKRAAEINNEIAQLSALSLTPFTLETPINVGAIIQLIEDNATEKWVFIAPAGAGLRINMAQTIVTVITPKAPLGNALINKQAGDEVELVLANKPYIAEIASVG